jgi:hypothetical protein
MADSRKYLHAVVISKGDDFEEYVDATFKEMKEAIMSEWDAPADKTHLLDSIWMLVQSAKSGNDWTIDFGCDKPEKIIPKHD